VSPVPTCPRCGSSHVRRGGLTVQPFSWVCADCLQKTRHLAFAVLLWRLWQEAEAITREAA
jgi:transposase-like protein